MIKTILMPIIFSVILSAFSSCRSQENRQVVITTTVNDGWSIEEKSLIWLIGQRSIEAVGCNDVLTYSIIKTSKLWIIVDDMEEPIGTLELMEGYVVVILKERLFTFKIKDDYVSS